MAQPTTAQYINQATNTFIVRVPVGLTGFAVFRPESNISMGIICDEMLLGTTGFTGCTGVGERGTLGCTGLTGGTGISGLEGGEGGAGATGPVGVEGDQGVDGYTGATGPTGWSYLGYSGPIGLTGVTGVLGPLGAPPGPTGLEPPTAAPGPTGPTGQGLVNPMLPTLNQSAAGEKTFSALNASSVTFANSLEVAATTMNIGSATTTTDFRQATRTRLSFIPSSSAAVTTLANTETLIRATVVGATGNISTNLVVCNDRTALIRLGGNQTASSPLRLGATGLSSTALSSGVVKVGNTGTTAVNLKTATATVVAPSVALCTIASTPRLAYALNRTTTLRTTASSVILDASSAGFKVQTPNVAVGKWVVTSAGSCILDGVAGISGYQATSAGATRCPAWTQTYIVRSSHILGGKFQVCYIAPNYAVTVLRIDKPANCMLSIVLPPTTFASQSISTIQSVTFALDDLSNPPIQVYTASFNARTATVYFFKNLASSGTAAATYYLTVRIASTSPKILLQGGILVNVVFCRNLIELPVLQMYETLTIPAGATHIYRDDTTFLNTDVLTPAKRGIAQLLRTSPVQTAVRLQLSGTLKAPTQYDTALTHVTEFDGTLYLNNTYTQGELLNADLSSAFPLTATSTYERVIAKCLPIGEWVWRTRISDSSDLGGGIAFDGSGNVYVGVNSLPNMTSLMVGSVDLLAGLPAMLLNLTYAPSAPSEFLTKSGYRGAVVKYDASGAYVSYFTFFGSMNSTRNNSALICRKVVLNAARVVYAGCIGYLTRLTKYEDGAQVILFDEPSTTIPASNQFAVIKNLVTYRMKGGDLYAADFGVSESNDVYLLASSRNSVSILVGSTLKVTVAGAQNNDSFLVLARFTDAGDVTWTALLKGSNSTPMRALLCVVSPSSEDAGGAYVLYHHADAATPVNAGGSINELIPTSVDVPAAVVKYTLAGSFEWAQPIGGAFELMRLYESNGAVLAELSYVGAFELSGTTYGSATDSGTALFKFTPEGDALLVALTA